MKNQPTPRRQDQRRARTMHLGSDTAAAKAREAQDRATADRAAYEAGRLAAELDERSAD